MSRMEIKFDPAGFAECLAGMDETVRAVAEQEIAKKLVETPGNYTVEVVHEPRFQDSSYGVARPVAVARIIGDAVASASEAENKTMSRAVSG